MGKSIASVVNDRSLLTKNYTVAIAAIATVSIEKHEDINNYLQIWLEFCHNLSQDGLHNGQMHPLRESLHPLCQRLFQLGDAKNIF